MRFQDNRRNFLRTMALASAGLASGNLSVASEKLSQDKRPNIVLMMGDDIGFSDIGCFGSEIETPNLDRLGTQGVRFRQFHNMAKCNPTRSSLFTGLYKGDKRALSMGQLMGQAGYATIMCGKEHFDSWVPDRCLAKNSFDHFFGFPVINEYLIPPSGNFQKPFFMGSRQLKTEEIETGGKPFQKTNVITDYALRFLDKTPKDKPFFLYLPYHAAHYPLQALPEDIAKYRGKYLKGWDALRRERFERMQKLGIIDARYKLSEPEGNINRFRGHPKTEPEIRSKIPLYRPWASLNEKEKDDLDLEMAVFAAMVDRLDQNIGRVIKKLDEMGVANNTLIMYLSDNGSCPYDGNKNFSVPPGPADGYRSLCAAWAHLGNTPFRHFKQFGHAGGSVTHFMARWPGVIKPGSFCDEPGHLVDILPTMLEMTEATYPKKNEGNATIPLHGSSLVPLFHGKKRPEPEYILSGLEKFRMFQQGKWKIIRSNGEAWELYDLDKDRSEVNDLATEKPERVKKMSDAYDKIWASMQRPAEKKRAEKS